MSLHPASAMALLVALVLLAGAAYTFRNTPAALVFIAYVALGDPIKAAFYEVGWLRPAIGIYPYSLTSYHAFFALGDVVLLVAFLFVWFYRSPPVRNLAHCHRLRIWSAVVFVGYTLVFWERAVRSWGQAVERAGNVLLYTPEQSFLNAATPLWWIATAILCTVAGSRLVLGSVLVVFGFTSIWGTDFVRSVVVAGVIALIVLRVERLRPWLAAGLVVMGLAAAMLGALTRGTASMSGEKVVNQGLVDIQMLDQTVSYFNRYSGDVFSPREPSAFTDTFMYGFMPRFIFRDKPGMYGNHVAEMALSPVTVTNARTLEREGHAGGFFPISTWVEMFYDFGCPFGVIAFLALGGVLRWVLHAGRTNVYAWMFAMITVSTPHGLLRGGSNWLMMGTQATLLFALTFGPLEWLAHRTQARKVKDLQETRPLAMPAGWRANALPRLDAKADEPPRPLRSARS